MKNFLHLIISLMVMLINCVCLSADIVSLDEESKLLFNHLNSISAPEFGLKDEDIEKIKEGLVSGYDQLRIQATVCVLLHRMEKVWKEVEPDMKRGTSNELAFVAYGLFGTARDLQLPLIEILPYYILDEAKAYRSADYQGLRGDVPLRSILVDLIVRDTINYSVKKKNFYYIKSLKPFELTSEQTQLILSVDKNFKEK